MARTALRFGRMRLLLDVCLEVRDVKERVAPPSFVCEYEGMTGRKMEFGATGAAVAANLRQIRTSQNLLYTQVSARLREIGREIPPLAVRRIEDGERQTTVDDLVALASVLGVSPVTLLMPASSVRSELVETAARSRPIHAERYWYWLLADTALAEDSSRAQFEFQTRSIPAWETLHIPRMLDPDAPWIEGRQRLLKDAPQRRSERPQGSVSRFPHPDDPEEEST